METKVDNVTNVVQKMDKKLDLVIKTKADKDDLKGKVDITDFQTVKANQTTLNNRLWGVVIFCTTMLISALAWFIRFYLLNGGLN